MLRSAENPELILRQYVDDLRAKIPQFNEQAAEVVKIEKMLAMEVDRLRQKTADLEAKVRTAVQLGPDKKEMAKTLISSLEIAKKELADATSQLEQSKINSEQIKKARTTYERQVNQKIQVAMQQISRAKRAEIEKQMSSLMVSFDVGDNSDVLDRMTAKIDEDLARAQAKTEIANESVSNQMFTLEADVAEDESESLYQEYQKQLGLAPVEPTTRNLDPIQPEVNLVTN